MALVFEHVGSAHASLAAAASEAPAQANGVFSENRSIARSGSALLAQQGAANAALKLLDDLCMMATGDVASNAHSLMTPT